MSIQLLIAEDDAADRCLLKRYLSRAEFPIEFQIVEDGEKICQQLEQQQPQVLCMDFNMPRLTAIEVLRKLDANVRSSMTIIVMSTLLCPAAEQELKDLGVTCLLTKTEDYSILCDQIIDQCKACSAS